MRGGQSGRFVAFEGIDGSGKSTALAAVAASLWRDGVPVATTREETATELGAWVRRSIEERMDPWATTFLFLADRAHHVQEIASWRRGGRHVLSDRFLHSTLAYQGSILADRLEDAVGFLRRLHEPWCPRPDHVVLFQADPETCVRRLAGRGGAPAAYEKAAFLGEVQRRYLELAAAEPDLFTVLDARQGAPEVAAEAEAAVRRALGLA